MEKKAEMVCPKAEIVPEGEEAEMGPKAMGPKALKLTYPKAEKCPKAMGPKAMRGYRNVHGGRGAWEGRNVH